jgi:hypothetical protein
MDIENDLKELDITQISILYWRAKKLPDKEIGKKFDKGEDWVEARMGEIYKELGFDPKMHARQKKKILEQDYFPLVLLLTNDDPDTLLDWPLQAKKDVDQNRPKSTPPTRKPSKTVDQPRPNSRSIWTWLWIPIVLLLLGALFGAFWLGRNNASQPPQPTAVTATFDSNQVDLTQSSVAPLLTDTAQVTDAPTDTLTPTLTSTPPATFTPIPTDTRSPFGLVKGDELSDNRVTMKLTDIQYNQKYDGIGAKVAPISFFFDFRNHSGETIVLRIESGDFHSVDNTGYEADCWFYHISGAGQQINEPLENGATRQIVARCGLGNLNPDVTTVTLTVHPFTSLTESTWVVEIP